MNICVIGGLNVDITGRVAASLIPCDSNPGHVSQSLGGVGRNIAENLVLLGAKVSLITALGSDRNGRWAREDCESRGMDMTGTAEIPGMATGTYLCLNNERGELYCAVSDMRVCDCITPDFLRERLSVINKSDAVVMDANLPADSISFLAQHCDVPLAADPVSVRKAEKLWPVLNRLTLLKPNRAEAAKLTGRHVETVRDAEIAAAALLGLGVRNVMLSLGPEGVWYADAQSSGQEKPRVHQTVSTNGCGDAFFAAGLVAAMHGSDIQAMARLGQAAAAICAESEAAVNPALTWKAVQERPY